MEADRVGLAPQEARPMARRRTLKDLAGAVKYVEEELDDFLDHRQPNWGRFDRELGFTSRTRVWRDHREEAFVLYTHAADGARLRINAGDLPCRINTYGDSFADGACVNDGETWQELLAARIGEPVRNFGIGGYSSYQAYQRMRRVERTDHRARYLILNILLEEDSYRNLDRWRWVRWHRFMDRRPGQRFGMHHANPGCHLRFVAERGAGWAWVQVPSRSRPVLGRAR
jgi:hypothetical protein